MGLTPTAVPLALILILPSLVVATPAPAGAGPGPDVMGGLEAQQRAFVEGIVAPWLAEGSATPIGPVGFDAYFAAFGLQPTAPEAQALAAFVRENPATAATIASLAGHLAQAEVARQATFERLTDEEKLLLYGALTAQAAGAPLDADQTAVLAGIDQTRLEASALALLQAAREADARLAHARTVDERIRRALPEIPDGAGVSDALRAIAAREAAGPSPADAPDWSVVVDSLRGRAPPDLLDALGPILAATSAAPGSAIGGVADGIDPLARAALNLSLASPGQVLATSGAARPALAPPASPFDAARNALRDVAGEPGAATPVPFEEGVERLYAAKGHPLPRETLEAARVAGEAMGPETSRLVGGLLAAQARYEADLCAQCPLPARVGGLRLAAERIAASGDPISPGDAALVRDFVQARDELRRVQADDAGAVLAAVEALMGGSTRKQASGPAAGAGPDQDVVFDDGLFVLVAGTRDSVFFRDEYPVPRALVVDLGGNDHYEIQLAVAHAGGAVPSIPPGPGEIASVAIDLGGSDTYATPARASLAHARGRPDAAALAVFADASGDDRYAAGAESLAFGKDALAFFLDVTGNDRYSMPASAIAHAETSAQSAVAAAVFADGIGNDRYASYGVARLGGQSQSYATVAIMADGNGDDQYQVRCDDDDLASTTCFAAPRGTSGTSAARGVVAFFDSLGTDTYSRAGEPQPFPLNPQTDPVTLRTSYASPPLQAGVDTSDSNGDGIPNAVASTVNPYSNDPVTPDSATRDADSDGFADLAEFVFRTDPRDPGSRPTSLPQGAAPGGSEGAVLLNVPGLVAIGLAGQNVYRASYRVLLDLGLAAGDPGSTDDVYHGQVAQGSGALAIDLSGSDAYAPDPVNGLLPPSLASVQLEPSTVMDSSIPPSVTFPVSTERLSGTALFLDAAGDDRYLTGARGIGAASGPGAVAVFLDASGDDGYDGRSGEAIGFATFGGHAYAFDLDGEDGYESRSQARVGRTGSLALGVASTPLSMGAVAFFMDRAGEDTYVIRVPASGAHAADQGQGWADPQPPIAGPSEPVEAMANASVAAFVDADGRDRYFLQVTGEERVDVTTEKDRRIRVAPLDGGVGPSVSAFLDLDLHHDADEDGDGDSDAAEQVAGSGARRDEDAATTQDGFQLRLPRLGIAIGSPTRTTYAKATDFALAVDLGGADEYLNRAGATSPVWPTAVLVDHAPDGSPANDAYRYESESVSLKDFAPFRGLARGEEDPLQIPQSGQNSPPLTRTIYYAPGIGSAQGAGVLGVGVLVDARGDNAFSADVRRTGCGCAFEPPELVVLAGVAQGAGLLGVGALFLGPEATGNFEANATAGITDLGNRTNNVVGVYAQGAAQGGVGLLLSTNPASDDDYVLRAKGVPDNRVRATHNLSGSGQGFAQSGLGLLLDVGGNNTFTSALPAAQGAAEVAYVRAYPSPRPAVGALVLTGEGNDTFASGSRSQGSARDFGVGLLYDAGGNDRHLLAPGSAQSLAASEDRALAMLVDLRGDDVYDATGSTRVLAHGRGGAAGLFDHGGNDRYLSGGDSLATATTSSNHAVDSSAKLAAGTGIVVLFDKEGNDVYPVPPGARAGGATWISPPPGAADGGPLHAIFLDAGGMDEYAGWPSRTFMDNARPAPEMDGNDAAWTQGAGGRGADVNSVAASRKALETLAARSLASTVQGACAGTSASAACLLLLPALKPVDDAVAAQSRGTVQVAVKRPGDGATVEGPLSGVVRLEAAVALAGPAGGAGAFERAEFFVNGTHVGTAWAPVAGGQSFALPWDTREQMDGHHVLEARVFARPDAAGAPMPDAEPLWGTRSVAIDNAPRIRFLSESLVHSVARGPLELGLWIGRDIERCPACPRSLDVPAVLQPPDEWVPLLVEPPSGPVEPDTARKDASQRPALTLTPAPGRAYLRWSPPASDPDVAYYRVDRRTPAGNGGAESTVAWIAGRSPELALVVADPAAPGPHEYRVAAVRKDDQAGLVNTSEGWVAYNPPASPPPGAARALRAMGAESVVSLAWSYHEPDLPDVRFDVWRCQGCASPRTQGAVIGSATGRTTYDDLTAVPRWTHVEEIPYRYQVEPARGTAGVLSRVAEASASPGGSLSVEIIGPQDATWMLDAPVAGNALLRIPWDAAAANAPDGEYIVHASLKDGALRSATMDAGILLDSTPPSTQILFGSVLGNGDWTESGEIRVPYLATDEGSGIASTTFFTRAPGGIWVSAATVEGNPGVATLPPLGDGASFEIIAISRDRAGNVEGVPGRIAGVTDADALAAKLATTPPTSHVIDASMPSIRDGRGGGIVRPGTRVPISATVEEKGSGLQSVEALVGSAKVPLSQKEPGVYAGAWVAGSPGDFQVVVVATDRVGNVATQVVGTVIVDAAPPEIGEIEVSFDGRSAAHPGEAGDLFVSAADDVSGVEALRGHVRVGGQAPVNLTLGSDGRLRAPVRVPSNQGEGLVRIDVSLGDEAGNLATRNHSFLVSRALPDLPAVNYSATGSSIEARWSTANVTRGRLEYGPTPELGFATPWSALGRNHSVAATGLDADSDVYARLRVSSGAGVEAATETVRLRTGPGLDARILPLAGLPFSKGNVALRVEGSSSQELRVIVNATDAHGRETTLADRLHRPGAPLALDLARLDDGRYALVARAFTAQARSAAFTMEVVLDKTPPVVEVLPGAPAQLRLGVYDAGSRIDVNNSSIAIDAPGAGRLACALFASKGAVACALPSLPSDVEGKVFARVADRAGNVATFEQGMLLDTGAPAIGSVSVRTDDGYHALRPGAEAVVAAEVSDAEGWSASGQVEWGAAVRDVSFTASGHQATARIRAPDAPSDARGSVRVVVTDEANRTSDLKVPVLVDAKAPSIQRASAESTSPRVSVVYVVADEPVTARVEAGGVLVGEAGTRRATHAVNVTRPAPGAAMDLVVTVLDAAGNPARREVQVPAWNDVEAPSAPGAPEVRQTRRGMRVSWAPATDDVVVASYEVTATAGDGAPARLCATNATACDLASPLTSGARISVVAIDAAGNRGPPATADWVPPLRPAAVEWGARAAGGAGVEFVLNVTWDAPTRTRAFLVLDGVRLEMGEQECVRCSFVLRRDLQPETFGHRHGYRFEVEADGRQAAFPEDGSLLGTPPVFSKSTQRGFIPGAASNVPGLAVGTVCLLIAALALARRKAK